MSLFPSILAPLDGSSGAARSLGCATWLASRFGARLHILSATSRELPAREELERLRVPEEHWSRVELHQTSTSPEEAILDAISRYDIRLVVMSAVGADAEERRAPSSGIAKVVGHVTQAVIERCAAPVLLLPPRYREALPWERLLVPASGGAESDEALVLAVRLANELGLEVHVAHISDPGSKDEEFAMRTRYSDQLHHEYRSQLEELVSRALPALAADECCRVQAIQLGRGDIAGELIGIMSRDRMSVLVVGWHGIFVTGRAQVLQTLIPLLEAPVLLTKCVRPARFQLKVGEELE